jgi:hypothetical protein
VELTRGIVMSRNGCRSEFQRHRHRRKIGGDVLQHPGAGEFLLLPPAEPPQFLRFLGRYRRVPSVESMTEQVAE